MALERAPLHPAAFERARAEIGARLRSRRAEIEQAVLTRAYAVSDRTASLDPDYLEGLRAAISAAVDFGFAVIERGEERAPQPPPALLAQARLAARHGVDLVTVLRRYSAGYALLFDFLIEEAEREGLRGAELQRLLRIQAALDRLLVAVSEEYARETRERPGTSEQRRAERIERLLAGELLDVVELAYDFDGHHLGILAKGPDAPDALRSIAASLDRRLLVARREEDTLWAWLGGRCVLEVEVLLREVPVARPEDCVFALGEPGEGLGGWRLTHRQARAALSIALRGLEPLVRYADVALLASVLQDELLVTSLRQMYLEPLEAERDGGEAAKETLRAYFASGRNASSAAAALGVNRNTVADRLRAIEQALDRSIACCGPELEAALRLAELGERGASPADLALR